VRLGTAATTDGTRPCGFGALSARAENWAETTGRGPWGPAIPVKWGPHLVGGDTRCRIRTGDSYSQRAIPLVVSASLSVR
jgi:hypothetical protein